MLRAFFKKKKTDQIIFFTSRHVFLLYFIDYFINSITKWFPTLTKNKQLMVE